MTTSNGSIKKLRRVQRSTDHHWVGNGFPVQTLFSYPDLGSVLSPFLLLDYAGPMEFPPTSERLGVGEHPHRGFETVTIVYSGEVEHRDSSGGGGRIGPGDVQWMTAGSGLVHEEFHGREFARSGGRFEVIQLWVNLPAENKMTPPRYQAIPSSRIPRVDLPDGQGSLGLIAGDYQEAKGPAVSFTPIDLWDLRLNGDKGIDLALPDGFTTALVMLAGTLIFEDDRRLGSAEVGIFDRTGEILRIAGAEDARALLLCGAPIDEPIVGSGPFVMNTEEEIQQAITDYRMGKMGHLP
jgi:quercetin 2,3-dioxygenase